MQRTLVTFSKFWHQQIEFNRTTDTDDNIYIITFKWNYIIISLFSYQII